ncbi:unnamed protein product [Tetraodon nigroviridis]|uniref:(spotted green pufferfish) hypothetical protein n=1 Tax=Tetraodon nigroviridis TaxID=99883 RepID=Q4SM60_TETNG|nr:unnamed protein product [Tetraodon nigroviridis]
MTGFNKDYADSFLGPEDLLQAEWNQAEHSNAVAMLFPEVLEQGPSFYAELECKGTKQTQKKQVYVKKNPLNAFMLFMKKQRPTVRPTIRLQGSGVVSAFLGLARRSLSRAEQEKYYKEAEKQRFLHQHQNPGWSNRENYQWIVMSVQVTVLWPLPRCVPGVLSAVRDVRQLDRGWHDQRAGPCWTGFLFTRSPSSHHPSYQARPQSDTCRGGILDTSRRAWTTSSCSARPAPSLSSLSSRIRSRFAPKRCSLDKTISTVNRHKQGHVLTLGRRSDVTGRDT